MLAELHTSWIGSGGFKSRGLDRIERKKGPLFSTRCAVMKPVCFVFCCFVLSDSCSM